MEIHLSISYQGFCVILTPTVNILKGKGEWYIFFPFFTLKKENHTSHSEEQSRQYRLGMCSRKCQDITQFLLKYFKRTNKNNPNILMGWVSQIIYIRICIPGNQERSRRERFLFFFPIHFLLPRPTIFLLPLPNSKKSLAFLQSQQTIFLQVFLLTILEACLAIL